MWLHPAFTARIRRFLRTTKRTSLFSFFERPSLCPLFLRRHNLLCLTGSSVSSVLNDLSTYGCLDAPRLSLCSNGIISDYRLFAYAVVHLFSSGTFRWTFSQKIFFSCSGGLERPMDILQHLLSVIDYFFRQYGIKDTDQLTSYGYYGLFFL